MPQPQNIRNCPKPRKMERAAGRAWPGHWPSAVAWALAFQVPELSNQKPVLFPVTSLWHFAVATTGAESEGGRKLTGE